MNRDDINLLIASSLQTTHPEHQVGLSDTHVFLKTPGQVFMIRVEEVPSITNNPDAESAAQAFMRTLPYGPE